MTLKCGDFMSFNKSQSIQVATQQRENINLLFFLNTRDLYLKLQKKLARLCPIYQNIFSPENTEVINIMRQCCVKITLV